MNAIEFTDIETARNWRAQHGGWIFAAETGEVIWFALGTTPTAIFLSRWTRGLSGTLI
jgi:hypothetical protein